jgi:hypothetical protein
MLGPENQQTVAEVRRRTALLTGALMPPPADPAGAPVQPPPDIPIPPFQSSGIQQVDDMNRERIAIMILMNQLAHQESIQDQLKKCRDALSAPLP